MIQTLQPATTDVHAHVREVVARAAHFLPSQGPIGVFIHHNTLHAFQQLPFEEAVVAAAEVFGAQPYMSEQAYRACLERRRILPDDIRAVMGDELNQDILAGRLDRRSLRTDLLVGGYKEYSESTIQWILEETDFLEPPNLALFEICLKIVQGGKPSIQPDAFRQSQDDYIHPLLIRLTAAFLDQGMAYWPMPGRERGFLNCVRELLSRKGAIFPQYLESVGKEFRRQVDAQLTAEEVIEGMLERLGIPQREWESVLQTELLALPGWAGIVHKLEHEPDLTPHVPLPCSLMDFLAVRLTLKAEVAANMGRQFSASDDLEPESGASGLDARHSTAHLAQAAGLLNACRILGITEPELSRLTSSSRAELAREIEKFGELERRRIWHLAYERRHEHEVLAPLARYRQERAIERRRHRPSADVFFCIDEREESMRRHLEEIAPDIETHSAAGFYGFAMEYTGIDDARGVALCPVVVKPQHAIREVPVDQDLHLYTSRKRGRRRWATLARHTLVSSRTLLRGWANTTLLWPLAFVPLILRVIAPLKYERLDQVRARMLAQPRTRLNFARSIATMPDKAHSSHSEKPGGRALPEGFTLTEKIDRVAAILGASGLHKEFARLVLILGHGSNSLNNPHESAHDCGACGGSRGGPNGRLFAAVANHPDVRRGLVGRGIDIPDDTWFIGGYHDTCDDNVELYDLDRVPASHQSDLIDVRAALNRARALDAQERARRFEAVGTNVSPQQALRHTEARAKHLCEPRPEYGHCTNAVCIVGRREVTRGLFLDRRAFLVSYDAALDPDDSGLARLLGAVIPVCAGISLEYYFSFVDNERYGCGTKLPHNITGLIGIMNGHASDLRTGLPWQMVEIHEPVRILFVVETTPERVMRVISANRELTEFLENRWIRLATLDHATGEIHIRRDGSFEKLESSEFDLPSVAKSADWFSGKLEHLPIARIGLNGRN